MSEKEFRDYIAIVRQHMRRNDVTSHMILEIATNQIEKDFNENMWRCNQ